MGAAESLGRTLERGRWRRRAAALGIVELTDRVVLAAAPGPVVTVLQQVLGEVEDRAVDWVVTAAPRVPAGGLQQVLGAAGTPAHPVGDLLAPRDLGAAIREGDEAARRA